MSVTPRFYSESANSQFGQKLSQLPRNPNNMDILRQIQSKNRFGIKSSYLFQSRKNPEGAIGPKTDILNMAPIQSIQPSATKAQQQELTGLVPAVPMSPTKEQNYSMEVEIPERHELNQKQRQQQSQQAEGYHTPKKQSAKKGSTPPSSSSNKKTQKTAETMNERIEPEPAIKLQNLVGQRLVYKKASNKDNQDQPITVPRHKQIIKIDRFYKKIYMFNKPTPKSEEVKSTGGNTNSSAGTNSPSRFLTLEC